MQYLRRLAHLFEHQHLTLTGAWEGTRWLGMTDRRLTIIEQYGPEEGIDEMHYIPSFVKGSINPMEMGDALTKQGEPTLPLDTPVITPEEEAEASGRPLIAALKAVDLINSTLTSTLEFTVPAAAFDAKRKWIAFRFCGKKLYVRSSDWYEGLGPALEFEFETPYDPAIEDGTCFAVPTELLKACRDLAGEDLVVSVKRTQSVYIGLRAPSCSIVYFCKPINLTENVVKNENPELTENTEEAAEASAAATENVQAAEEPAPQEPTAVEPTEPEETAPQEPTEPEEAEEPTEPAETKPVVEDVDPMVALDELIPEVMRRQDEVNKQAFKDMRVLVRNVAKQCRKALKSTADPQEMAELKKQLTAETRRADKATQDLQDLKDSLKALKGIL